MMDSNLMSDAVADTAKGKLNYEKLEDRMKTFKLPPQWEGPVDYQSMAEAGFVYIGQEDLVYCFSCNIKLDRWSKDMEPLLRHKEESPTCSFMRQKLQAVKKGKTKSVVAPSKPLNSRLTSSIGELQSSSLITSKGIHAVVTGLNEPRLSYGGNFDDRPGAFLPITPENYQSEAERIKSFVGWPLNETVHPEQLARIGFVYTGEGALVQCFQCGVKYRHWYKGDVPLNVHQKCNPRCPFLQTLTSKSKSSPPERQPTRSYIQPESIGSNTQGEEVRNYSLQFPDYSDQAVRLQSFKHWGGVLPAQELAEGGFYMIARRDVVRFLSGDVVLQKWDVNVTYRVYLFVYNGVACIMKNKLKFANKVPVNNDRERTQRIQHSPDWWSNPPGALSQDNSNKHFHTTESQQKSDNTVTSLQPSKIKIMVWFSLSLLSIFGSPFKLPPQWEGPVDYQSMAEAGFVYTGQEDLVCKDRWPKDMEPLLRHKEESLTRHELQAIEGGKTKSAVAPSKPLEATKLNERQLSYEHNGGHGVSVLVVGSGYKQKERSETTPVNLSIQAEHNEFSTSFTSPQLGQSSTEAIQVVPLPHFINVTRRDEILSFPGSGTVDYSDSVDDISEDKGAICPPDFDVPMPSPSDVQLPSVPVQSSEAVDRSAVLINQPMKTSFVDCDPLDDVDKSPETSNALFSDVKKQDSELIEGNKPGMELVCQICWSYKVKYALLPCGHVRTCEMCTERIKLQTRRCPFCRQSVNEFLVAILLD